MKLRKNFTYVDLFAGIGGFHCAMDQFSNNRAKCIYASEIDPDARKIYKNNFKIVPLGDIRKINPAKFESPDVVCGGFPCQTFSKAGKRDGFKDPRGTLFKEIIRIIEFYKFSERPKILYLENVRNLINHDNGETWKTIKHEIKRVGYNIIECPLVVSPIDVGVPQLRERALILAVRKDLYNLPINISIKKAKKNKLSVKDVLSNRKNDLVGSRILNENQKYAIDCWNDFIKGINRKIIGFPIWSDEFGKTYKISNLPVWKQEFINQNRKLYKENKKFIDAWLKKWNVRNKLTPTNRKFEWQVGGKVKDAYQGIIQFRPSGIRVKRLTESPALVAMVQLPIIGPLKRTISVREAARLQSFPDSYKFDESDSLAFKQLGNAVNVAVIRNIFKKFIDYIKLEKE